VSDRANRDVDETTYYRRHRPKRSTLALTVRTALLAGIATLAVSAGLALQMALGNDPALGGGGSTQAADTKRPTIVKTTVVKRVVPSSSGTGSSSSSGSYSSGSSSYTAPAPAPAPVTSSTS